MTPIESNLAPRRPRHRLPAALVACCATLLAAPGHAGIALPDVPLQAGTSVPPNIMFVLDDSGSMQSEILPDESIDDVSKRPDGTAAGLLTIGRVFPRIDTLYGSTFDGEAVSDYTDYVADPSNVYGRIVRSPTFNSQYYDPTITYRPWARADGSSHPDASTTCAYWNPMDTAKGCVNLTTTTTYSDRYWQRTDATHCPTEACVREASSATNTRDFEFNIYYRFTGDATSLADKYDADKYTKVTVTGTELQNFANWFQYYRSRILASRAGIGRAFATLPDSAAGSPRIGFGTINSGGTLVNAVRPFAGTNRTSFYEKLYGGTIPKAGTPLRGALEDVGEYYKSEDEADDPWRTAVGAAADPKHGEYLACRQSFAMLMTDGYWNGDDDLAVNNVDVDAGYPFADTHSNTLADVAYKYWKDDLRSTIPNRVPPSTLDPGTHQRMVTYGIGLGVTGQISRDAAFGEIGKTSGTLVWPDPHAGSAGYQPSNKIDDLLHAAVNSRGGFFSAANPDEFAQGLGRVLTAIVARAGSGSNVATNSVSIGSDTRVFQASYVAGNWTGELAAYPITAAGIGGTAAWKASEQIPAAASRRLFTWNNAGSGSGTFFSWGSLTTAQKSALGDSEAVFDYLRGIRSGERQNGGSFRNRSHLLGDIVDSSPAFVKDTNTIYVGANDGMLHAFDAATGAELFAYVPHGINWNALAGLSNPAYAHRYFVDGSVVASTRAQTPDKTLVAAALGRGGRGVFALDATAPSTFSTSKVLWDKTGSLADADMGQVLGRPVIARVRTNASTVVTALLVANGPNSANDRAVLFIYNLETGALISKIDTGSGSSTAPNGLSAPRGWDSDGDGVTDRVYAGDLLGNLWRFDLRGAVASWDDAGSRVVMFAAGSSKPITGSPSVALHPDTYDAWVFFGTGRYLTSADPANLAVQSLYGIKDSTTTVAATDLQQRRIRNAGTINGTAVRGFEAAGALTAGKLGWTLDWLDPPYPPGTAAGERVIGDSGVFGRILVVASVIPSADDCAQGGRGYINALDAFTGASLSGGFFDVDGDGRYDDDTLGDPPVPVGSIDPGVGMPTDPSFVGIPPVPAPPCTGPSCCVGEACAPPPPPPGCQPELGAAGGSSGGTATVRTLNCLPQGRISWRELIRD